MMIRLLNIDQLVHWQWALLDVSRPEDDVACLNGNAFISYTAAA
jgi:hypothetical protein